MSQCDVGGREGGLDVEEEERKNATWFSVIPDVEGEMK